MKEVLDAAEWLVLDNLRRGEHWTNDFDVLLIASDALGRVIRRGFAAVIDEFDQRQPVRFRITRKGQIALRRD
jgi:hypothetical protein